jgi:hypothetical protein
MTTKLLESEIEGHNVALLAPRTQHQAWRSIADYGALRSWGAAVASTSVVMNNVEMWFIRWSSLFQ